MIADLKELLSYYKEGVDDAMDNLMVQVLWERGDDQADIPLSRGCQSDCSVERNRRGRVMSTEQEKK